MNDLPLPMDGDTNDAQIRTQTRARHNAIEGMNDWDARHCKRERGGIARGQETFTKRLSL
jgi:hypothetical protein